MSDGMGREFTYLSSQATNRYFIPNWGTQLYLKISLCEKSAISPSRRVTHCRVVVEGW